MLYKTTANNLNYLFIIKKIRYKKTRLAKSTIWLWVKEGKFPKPIKLSPRVTVWEEEKVNNWMNKKI
ncbi:MAG: helix-turn-helix transcriptional regulator [Halarcobacter sp.]